MLLTFQAFFSWLEIVGADELAITVLEIPKISSASIDIHYKCIKTHYSAPKILYHFD